MQKKIFPINGTCYFQARFLVASLHHGEIFLFDFLYNFATAWELSFKKHHRVCSRQEQWVACFILVQQLMTVGLLRLEDELLIFLPWVLRHRKPNLHSREVCGTTVLLLSGVGGGYNHFNTQLVASECNIKSQLNIRNVTLIMLLPGLCASIFFPPSSGINCGEEIRSFHCYFGLTATQRLETFFSLQNPPKTWQRSCWVWDSGNCC